MTGSLRASAILLAPLNNLTQVAASDMNDSLRATAILLPSPRGFASRAADIERRPSDKDRELGSHGHYPPCGECLRISDGLGYDWELACHGHTPLSVEWHYLSSRDINRRPSDKTGMIMMIH